MYYQNYDLVFPDRLVQSALFLTCYNHWRSKGNPYKNFKAMRILRQCASTEKVPLH